jgi:enoyl-CoA hydratase
MNDADQTFGLTELRYREEDSVAVITLAAPGRRNALTPTMSRAIIERLEEAEANPNIGALVLNAEGPTFSAGADRALLAAVDQDPLSDAAYRQLGDIYQMFVRLQSSAIPTVAAIQGAVVGASVNLALACDVRIVADDLRVVGFGIAGLHPGGGHLRLLARCLGTMGGASLALFGRDLDSTAALATGFAAICVPKERLLDEALALARGATHDVQLIRAVTASWRLAAGEPLSAAAAVQMERAAQLWSLSRRYRSKASLDPLT